MYAHHMCRGRADSVVPDDGLRFGPEKFLLEYTDFNRHRRSDVFLSQAAKDPPNQGTEHTLRSSHICAYLISRNQAMLSETPSQGEVIIRGRDLGALENVP
jgi:hypothetical protein